MEDHLQFTIHHSLFTIAFAFLPSSFCQLPTAYCLLLSAARLEKKNWGAALSQGFRPGLNSFAAPRLSQPSNADCLVPTAYRIWSRASHVAPREVGYRELCRP